MVLDSCFDVGSHCDVYVFDLFRRWVLAVDGVLAGRPDLDCGSRLLRGSFRRKLIIVEDGWEFYAFRYVRFQTYIS